MVITFENSSLDLISDPNFDELIQAQSKDYFDNNLDCSTSKI